MGNYLYIGGIIAITERNKTDLTNMTNNGAINFNGTMVKGSLRIGGFTGYVKSYFSNVTNNAPITLGEKSSTVFTQVGGLVAYFAKGTSGNLSNLVNTEKGDITLNGTINGSVRLSGCIADKVAYSHTIDTCVNSGDLTVNGIVTGLLTVGGNVALMASPGADSKMKDTFTNFTNNGKITVKQLTLEFGVSDTYLQNAFRSVYGMPVISFIRTQKMQSAAQVLIHTTQTVEEIAQTFGYENESKFSAAFKRIMGDSPGVYRKEHSKIKIS